MYHFKKSANSAQAEARTSAEPQHSVLDKDALEWIVGNEQIAVEVCEIHGRGELCGG